MPIGDTTVQIVSAPINAGTIKTAIDDAITAIGILSGQYMVASFNDGRGMAIIGIEYQ